ncbi:erythritol ABC transporter ATP-binding protein [Trinickia symbiotica]|uniref:Sugar ABC transporter ATP-binding protein n=1 Tax=Trinickia symbiotica TaxID=863227 RepID=A0A2N7WZJ4_9BURK|nr:sugar ABC transporter ATP-binding protein [Trinickia symbiotica]PMS34916.1 sugar ABC transporter ATP-binding protein [Trinickia symbiotica]PPK45143.1 erythritol ABC transporter ATP-binding protein [Trinickia symbiotica]
MSDGADAVVSHDDVILSVEAVTKVYPGTTALKEVSFVVHRAAVNVLVGENGAGKSTLMRIIAGAEQPTSGRLVLDGAPIELADSAQALRHGIGIVHQELNLFPNLSIAENVFLGREMTRGRIHIDANTQRTKVRALLERLELDLSPDTLVEELPIGQQQLIEIAKALAQDARILILDEPTSALSAAEVEVLFRVIADLKSHGVAIVYISHRLEELIRIGDYITVLRDGRITGHQRMARVDVRWIVQQMVGRETRDFARPVGHERGAEVLGVRALSLPKKGGGYLVDHVSLTLHAGEIVGIYGLMGAGRSELFECILGCHAEAEGEVVLAGKPLSGRAIAERVAEGVTLIPEDRKADALLPILSIGSNMTLSSLRTLARGFDIDPKHEQSRITRYIGELAMKVADWRLPVSSLSGGNQQKVVIARALMTTPKVLLMDEPSRGIDVGAKADIFKVMRELSVKGLGILFATSDLEEVMALSDRILVMSSGRVTAEFEAAEATQHDIVAASAVGRRAAASLHETDAVRA